MPIRNGQKFTRLLVAILAATSACVSAAQQSTVTEIDLIFPRNETYKPTFPFPVIFAIQNPAIIWPYWLRMEIMLYPWLWIEQDGGLDESWPKGDSIEDTVTHDVYPGEDDPLILTYFDKSVVNLTAHKWVVSWRIHLTPNCTGEPPKDYFNNTPTEHLQTSGSLFLTLDPESDNLPKIYVEDNSTCPTTLWTVDIIGESDNYETGRVDYSETCPYFNPENPHPEGNPCAVRATKELEQNVTDTILNYMQCVDMTSWPNTSHTYRCRDEEWEPNASQPSRGIVSGTLLVGCLVIMVAWYLEMV